MTSEYLGSVGPAVLDRCIPIKYIYTVPSIISIILQIEMVFNSFKILACILYRLLIINCSALINE